jgi:hypothetical protein
MIDFVFRGDAKNTGLWVVGCNQHYLDLLRILEKFQNVSGVAACA